MFEIWMLLDCLSCWLLGKNARKRNVGREKTSRNCDWPKLLNYRRTKNRDK